MKKEKILLGIDPGTQVSGYGLVRVSGSELSLVQFGIIRLQKYGDHFQRLKILHERIKGIIKEYEPNEVAFEAPFHGKNVQAMLKLGRAQGVAMVAALEAGLPVAEYAPRSVKKAVAGNGAASKEQVARMLKQTLKGFQEIPEMLDATDAVAVAVCHHYQSQNPLGNSRAKDWKSFLVENPERLKK